MKQPTIRATVIAGAAAPLLRAVTASAAPARAGETCLGLPSTIVGTEGDDTIAGTPGHDVIVGLGDSKVKIVCRVTTLSTAATSTTSSAAAAARPSCSANKAQTDCSAFQATTSPSAAQARMCSGGGPGGTSFSVAAGRTKSLVDPVSTPAAARSTQRAATARAPQCSGSAAVASSRSTDVAGRPAPPTGGGDAGHNGHCASDLSSCLPAGWQRLRHGSSPVRRLHRADQQTRAAKGRRRHGSTRHPPGARGSRNRRASSSVRPLPPVASWLTEQSGLN